ncbi:MAG: GDSL-type esterase/lipase family protein, partial [Chloroflexi bacterium]|nr:GDSL-type esterase/lipase family protein [Chloroflexota bacterium]
MQRRTVLSKWFALGMRAVLAALAGLLLVGVSASADAAKVGYPNSMAAAGDSITRAYNTGWFPYVDAPSNSWSTGTSSAVNSHYTRLLAKNSAISGKNYNDAKTGGNMSDLSGQVTTIVSQGVEYVTILLGANDARASSESTMTPVSTYHDQFASAMASLSSGLPDARIYVSSVPDVYHLWEIFHNDARARSVWALFNICPALLANPTSTAQVDQDRRLRVRQRVIEFNTQLQQVCVQYIHCRYDNKAGFNLQFTTSDITTRDYFHPSVAGQAKAASTSWAATFNFTDK